MGHVHLFCLSPAAGVMTHSNVSEQYLSPSLCLSRCGLVGPCSELGERRNEVKRHTLPSLTILKGAPPLISSQHPHSQLREVSHHPCIQLPEPCPSVLRPAACSPEMSCNCCFRGLNESVTFLIFHINRDFLNIHPRPDTMLGAAETEIQHIFCP